MYAIFAFVNYGKKISYKKLKNLIKELSIACEVRGTYATNLLEQIKKIIVQFQLLNSASLFII